MAYRIAFSFAKNYARIAPAGEHRHLVGSRQKKLKVKVKGQGQIGQKLDFSDGVPHNLFIFQPIMPKLHQHMCIKTSLAQGKENSRSRSKIKVKWAKNSIF